jgi:hypothetical protein
MGVMQKVSIPEVRSGRGWRREAAIWTRSGRSRGPAEGTSGTPGIAWSLVWCLLAPLAHATPGPLQAPSVAPAPLAEPSGDPAEHSGTLHLASNLPPVDPLIAAKDAPFFPSRARTDCGAVTLDMFTSAEACKECHAQIYAQWSGSMMAHAWTDPVYREILRRASAATDGAVDKFCIGCHSPIGLTTGTVDAQKKEDTKCSGVSCDACHTIASITGTGNGSFVLEPVTLDRPVKYGPRDDALSPFHDTTHSDLHTRSEFCASCHNVTHPFNRMPVERTYDEWRDSPYNVAGVRCQDCHMTPAPGMATDARIGGKERQDVYSHFFAGANATMALHFGLPDVAERARAMLRTAATIEFVKPPSRLEPGTRAEVLVQVTNVGAGHKLPTGFPEGREVWIDLKVQDAAGVILYESGAIRDGRTEPGTRSFKSVLGDPDGHVVDLEVWKADRMLSDTRILPKGHALEDYSFTVPADAKGPLTLTADLKYASFSQEFLDELLGKGVLKSEIVLMTSAALTVELGGALAAGPTPEVLANGGRGPSAARPGAPSKSGGSQ